MLVVMMNYAVMVTRWMVMYAEDHILAGPKLLKASYLDLDKDKKSFNFRVIIILTRTVT